MLNSALELLASILWLASGLGVLGAVGLFLLPYLWSQWTEAKYDMDLEGKLYQEVADALERAEGQEVEVIIRSKGEVGDEG
jgi:hypothetical protein